MTPAQNNEARFLAAVRGTSTTGPVLALYKRLVRGNVVGVVEGVLPLTVAALGPALHEAVDAFLRAGGPRTAHVRDVPFELVASVARAWPAHVQELARFELADFRASYAPRTTPEVRGDLALEAPLAYRGPVLLESFGYAVQADPTQRDDHALLFYRDEAEAVRTLRLSPMAHGIVRRTLAGEPLQNAMIAAAAEAGLELDEATLGSAARFLDDLAERGIVLGAG